jgi:hypothetical protein
VWSHLGFVPFCFLNPQYFCFLQLPKAMILNRALERLLSGLGDLEEL